MIPVIGTETGDSIHATQGSACGPEDQQPANHDRGVPGSADCHHGRRRSQRAIRARGSRNPERRIGAGGYSHLPGRPGRHLGGGGLTRASGGHSPRAAADQPRVKGMLRQVRLVLNAATGDGAITPSPYLAARPAPSAGGSSRHAAEPPADSAVRGRGWIVRRSGYVPGARRPPGLVTSGISGGGERRSRAACSGVLGVDRCAGVKPMVRRPGAVLGRCCSPAWNPRHRVRADCLIRIPR